MEPAAVGFRFGRLLSVKRAAQVLGISIWTVRKWIAAGWLEHVRLGRRTLVPSRALEALVAAATCGGGPRPGAEVSDESELRRADGQPR